MASVTQKAKASDGKSARLKPRDAGSTPARLSSFDFLAHTRLVFGVNSVERVGELARELGARRVLVVTDPGIVTAGHADRVEHILQSCGLGVLVFDGVRENPT